MRLCKFFRCDVETELQQLELLKQENAKLKEKLAERQEVINKTNAYWKKRVAQVSATLRSRKL